MQVEWNAVALATGYRVYRTDSAGGSLRFMAEINVVSGYTWALPDVVNIWSTEHTYLPRGVPLAGADRSSRFRYVDYGGPDVRYYRLQAYNTAGSGPLSAVTGGTPVVGPPPTLPA